MYCVLHKISDNIHKWTEYIEQRKAGTQKSPSVTILQEEDAQVDKVKDGTEVRTG
jgi:hypothetical protein